MRDLRELGHTSLALFERTYGHLMENRLRRAEVSYRPPLTLVQNVSA